MPLLFAETVASGFGTTLVQFCIDGLVVGSLVALIALGYTMVYGIVELINFAHGDVFMLGSLLALTLVGWFGLHDSSGGVLLAGVLGLLAASSIFCAGLNLAIDRLVYRPLRDAPKLAPLVSAIGVSFTLMNVGLLWIGAAEKNFPQLVSGENLLGSNAALRISMADVLVVAITVPTMIALTLFVKKTRLGKAMRATAQDATAAKLMGIDVDRVIGATFLIGGALAGVAAVIYGVYVKTVGYQMGYTNGLYAFTAAVLGGIGNIPGAMLGGIVIGLVRALGTGLVGANWTDAIVFGILILILVFRPSGLLGSRAKEKV